MKKAAIFTVSLPQDMIDLINEYAALTERSRSAVTQEIITLGMGVISDKYNEMKAKENVE